MSYGMPVLKILWGKVPMFMKVGTYSVSPSGKCVGHTGILKALISSAAKSPVYLGISPLSSFKKKTICQNTLWENWFHLLQDCSNIYSNKLPGELMPIAQARRVEAKL